MPQNTVAGKGGSVEADGATLLASDANVEEHGDDIDGTNFNSEGKDEGTVGPIGLQWDFKANWTPTDDPRGAPGLYVRDDLSGLDITPTGGAPASMGTARVLSSKLAIPVRGKIESNCSGKSQGDYTFG